MRNYLCAIGCGCKTPSQLLVFFFGSSQQRIGDLSPNYSILEVLLQKSLVILMLIQHIAPDNPKWDFPSSPCIRHR